MSDSPKSALELALERLKKKDADAGVFDPQELELHREHLLRDLAQFESDRDAKVRKIRGE
jgi:hypothetical protein